MIKEIKELNLGWSIVTNALYYFQSWLAHLLLQSFNHIDASYKDAASKSILIHKFLPQLQTGKSKVVYTSVENSRSLENITFYLFQVFLL